MEQNKVTPHKTESQETMKTVLTPKRGRVDWINESNHVEHNKVLLMRAFVEKQDPFAKLKSGAVSVKLDVDDFTLKRFLRARDSDIEKACAMFLNKYIKWRQSFVPNGLISVSEIPKELAQNKFFMQGSDKKGRTVGVLLCARHFHNKGGLEEFQRFAVFNLDKLCSRTSAGQEKFVAIADLEGWGYSNSDMRANLSALSILQDYYPETLEKLYIIHVPYIFMAVWKVVYPFIDNKTKKKIVFVENKKLKSTLLEDIDESQLPEIYGGKLKLVPVQDS